MTPNYSATAFFELVRFWLANNGVGDKNSRDIANSLLTEFNDILTENPHILEILNERFKK